MADRLPAALADADDQRSHQRCWRAERIGRVLIIAVLIAGGLGLLGSSGPLAKRTIAGQGMTLSAPRVVRHEAPVELTLRLEQSASEIWIAHDYLAQADLRQVLPTPTTMRSEGERCVLTFATPVDEIRLSLSFAGYLPRHGVIGVGDAQLSFTQWMLP